MTVNRPEKHEQLSANPDFGNQQNYQVGKIEQLGESTVYTLPPLESTKLVFFQTEQQNQKERITQLETENKRLRDALTQIANWKLDCDSGDADGFVQVCNFADEALKKDV